MAKSDLRLDWATHKAAKYACENWHYSRSMPVGKLVKVGVWESKEFVGVVIFSRGANRYLVSPYGLRMAEGCELTRVALKEHNTPVSRILSIAIKMLKTSNPNLRLIVSYSDKDQNHHGGIYQATNWVYDKFCSQKSRSAFIIRGEKTHPKTVHSMGVIQSIREIRKHLDPNAEEFFSKGKHRYLMPLDAEMRSKSCH